MVEGRFTFRKAIVVPASGTGEVHIPERIGSGQGMIVTCAELFLPSTNTGTIYVGWHSVSANAGNEIGIPLLARDVLTIQSPKRGEDGQPEKFDLYDLWVTGSTDKDALQVFTW